MTTNYYQKHEKSSEKKQVKDIKIFGKTKTKNHEKRPETDIKIFLKKRKKKGILTIILRNKSKS